MALVFFIFWVALAFVVASTGENRKIGYGATLALSLIFSPLIGLLVVLVSDKKEIIRRCKSCSFIDRSNAQFCPACGKDSKGYDKDHYQRVINDPEYRMAFQKVNEENEKSVKEEVTRKNTTLNNDIYRLILIFIGLFILLIIFSILKR